MLFEIKYLGLTFSYHVAMKLNVNYITVHNMDRNIIYI